MDTLPLCGAIVTLLAICKLTHRPSYLSIAAVTMVFPLIALVMVIAPGTVLMILKWRTPAGRRAGTPPRCAGASSRPTLALLPPAAAGHAGAPRAGWSASLQTN